MMTPAQALLWQVWRRHRYGLFLGWGYLAVAAVLIRLLPSETLEISFYENDIPWAFFRWLVGLPCVFVVVHALTIFSMNDAVTKDGYSPRMFVLPVTTRWLVAWPMIYGCVLLAGQWLVIATAIARPAGLEAPLWWPIAMLAVCLTGLQAISWVPLTQTWLRGCIAVPSFMTFIGVAIALAIWRVPETINTGLLAMLLPITYIAGLRGVAMARRGDAYDWRAWQRLWDWAANWRKPAEHPFSSPGTAQLWFECRGHAWFLPLFVGLMMACMSLLFTLADREDVALSWKFLAMMAALPPFMAGMVGAHLAARDAWSKYTIGPFMATRPFSSAAMVRSKLAMCAISAAATVMVTFVWLPALLLRPGFAQSINELARAVGIWRAAMAVTVGVVGVFALTWMQLAASLWMGLTGREWVVNAVVFCLVGLMAIFGSVGFWVFLHPELHSAARAAVPWVTGLFLLLKLSIASCTIAALVGWGAATPMAAAKMVGIWALVVAGTCAVVFWLAPTQLESAREVVAGFVLAVPFSRLAGAPLALAWNRHR